MEKKIKQLLKIIKLNEDTLSLIFGALTVVLVGILVFRMYRTNQPEITKIAEQTSVSPAPTQTIGQVKVETKEDGKVFATNLPDTYKVERGEHLWKIAEKLYGSGYNWVDLAQANGIKNASVVSVGQELKVPKVEVRLTSTQKAKMVVETPTAKAIEGDSYVVEKGDNLWEIAVRAYADGYKWPEIAKANNLKNANVIEVGQKLSLPR